MGGHPGALPPLPPAGLVPPGLAPIPEEGVPRIGSDGTRAPGSLEGRSDVPVSSGPSRQTSGTSQRARSVSERDGDPGRATRTRPMPSQGEKRGRDSHVPLPSELQRAPDAPRARVESASPGAPAAGTPPVSAPRLALSDTAVQHRPAEPLDPGRLSRLMQDTEGLRLTGEGGECIALRGRSFGGPKRGE